MTILPTCGVDLTKPETHSEAFIASRMAFIRVTWNGHKFHTSMAIDDEAEIIQVHIAEKRRTAVYEPETQTGKLQLTAVFA